jgi:glycosyltransferase involved in cell wall biosynthesis
MPTAQPSLKILHVFRSPVGGLFRHVADLVEGQSARGHRVGLITDSLTGGAQADARLAQLADRCTLGISRIPMSRHIGAGDVKAVRHTTRRIAATAPDVVHGHGAKGAAYARLATKGHAVTVYTPHGGSLHYRRSTPMGLLYITLEKLLMPRTNLFLFESEFARQSFHGLIGRPKTLERVVRNGVGKAEFAEVPLAADATDLLYIGELRDLKGVDLLLEALATLRQSGMALSATIVGDGPWRQTLREQAARLQIDAAVRFLPPMPARAAFALGRIVVVPSRKESLPYIVLEIAAAAKPLVATRVGGIPEIFGPYAGNLVAPDDSAALADKLKTLVNHADSMTGDARLLQAHIRTTFSLRDMVEDGIDAYRAAIAAGRFN